MRPILRAQGSEYIYKQLRLAMTNTANTARLRGVGSAVGRDVDLGNGMGKNIHDVHSLSLEKSIVNHIMKDNCI